MSTKPLPQSASEWIVALKEEPGDEALRQAHQRWLAGSESNRRDWEETLQLWRLMAMALPAHIEEWHQPDAAPATRPTPSLRRPPTLPHRTRGRPHQRRRVLAGFGVALAACVALAVLPDALLSLRADHSSTTGEIKTVDLPDGSHIQLAPESAVALSFEPSERRVELLRGEAFFNVAGDARRPFRVQAGELETQVLGTRFAVSLGRVSAQVAVEEGSVQVSYPSEPASTASSRETLSPGERLRLGPDGRATSESVSPSLVAAWRDGKLVAQNRPFGELVTVLERYFDGWIVVTDAELAQEPLTGIYLLSDPKAALRAMAATQGATLRQVSPWVLVVSRR